VHSETDASLSSSWNCRHWATGLRGRQAVHSRPCPRWYMGLYQLAEIRWSGCGPHLVSQYSQFITRCLNGSQCNEWSSGLVSVRPWLWQTTLARLFWARCSLSPHPLFPDKTFSLTFPWFISKIPDISLTAVKFPDISRFSKQVVTLHSRPNWTLQLRTHVMSMNFVRLTALIHNVFVLPGVYKHQHSLVP